MVIRQLTADDVTIFYPFRLRSLRESPHAFLRSFEEYSRESLESVAQRFRQQAVANIDFTLGAFEAHRAREGAPERTRAAKRQPSFGKRR